MSLSSSALSRLLDDARRVLPDVVDLRRRLHAEPELGLVLPETQRKVLAALAPLGLELAHSAATSSVIATLRGGRPGATVLLRADMDALPLQEETELDFASCHPGRMHACGHDAHTAMLVGAAQLLAERREELPGTVKFLFQAGEEGFGGARILIEEGMLDADPIPDFAFALHVNPTLRSGRVATRPGAFLAAQDTFEIDVVGQGGHGSMPHDARDPIPVAAEIVMALQSFMTRRIDPFDPAVLTVTRIDAGTTTNVIPEQATLSGTFRSVSPEAREAVRAGLTRVVAGVCAAHDMEPHVRIRSGYPVTANDAEAVAWARPLVRALLGERSLADMRSPLMGAEDFSYVLERIPGLMVFLGVRPGDGEVYPIHSNRMRLDEESLGAGVALHAAVALSRLEGSGAP